jgi:hypothetical protein
VVNILERTVPGTRLDDTWNGFWMMSVTQTTIGYGDVVADTYIGRLLCCIMCLLSIIFVSFFVISINGLS